MRKMSRTQHFVTPADFKRESRTKLRSGFRLKIRRNDNSVLRRLATDQRGYTLVETLVAMAVFVSVVIPIGAAIGNMMVRNDSHLMLEALRLGQTELERRTEDVNEGESNFQMKTFTIVSNVQRNGDLFEVDVHVWSSNTPKKDLVKLHKTVLLR